MIGRHWKNVRINRSSTITALELHLESLGSLPDVGAEYNNNVAWKHFESDRSVLILGGDNNLKNFF